MNTQPQPVQHRNATRSATTTQNGLNAADMGNASRSNTVPQFLNKLWNMVNDPGTDHLIKWSDSGDSFYIFDQDKFAKEVLGNFYKTENISSFVRQLNMYGFHKIQHIRQGAIRGNKESQAWQFSNPHFQRGQPDLLCLIERRHKAGAGNAQNNAVVPLATGGASIDSTEGQINGAGTIQPAASQALTTNGQQLDIGTIVNGLTAIKRHQEMISRSLKEVQQSNQALWQEAMEARERHKKHQDTINRILKFLATLYHPNQASGAVVKDQDSVGLVPKPMLLLTGSDEIAKTPSTVRLEEVDESKTPTPSDAFGPMSPTVETPGGSKDNTLLANGNFSSTTNANPVPTPSLDSWNPASLQRMFQMYPHLANMQSMPVLPTSTNDNSMALTLNNANNSNAIWNLFTSPSAPLTNNTTFDPNAFDPNFSLGSSLTSVGNSSGSTSNGFNSNPSPLDLLLSSSNNDLAHMQGLIQSTGQLQQINEGVDQMGTDLDNIISALPLDPAHADAIRSGGTINGIGGNGAAGHGGSNDAMSGLTVPSNDLDVDAILKHLGSMNGIGNSNIPSLDMIDPLLLDSLGQSADLSHTGSGDHDDNSGFLDEIGTNGTRTSTDLDPMDGILPPLLDNPIPPITTNPVNGKNIAAGKKRKSDAAELGIGQGLSNLKPGTGPKPKKRK